jgi:hypothetical protein
MIQLRFDVDYPYPSRNKSFILLALNRKFGKDYLKNSKIIAQMINESTQDVKAYWFFTTKTLPDRELMELLKPDKHEICLHVVNKPNLELENLEKITQRKINYYTIHGTARLSARILWRRIRAACPKIPQDFPLKSLHELPTISIDRICYDNSNEKTLEITKNSISEHKVLEFHPEWIFQKGTLNHRGPYYGILKKILEVDSDLDILEVRKKAFIRMARKNNEYAFDAVPSEEFLAKISLRDLDVFTFIERKWCCPISNPSKGWLKADDNIALLHVASFDEWWSGISKKTRNMVRKAEKSEIKTQVVEPNEKLAEGVWIIYNETPIRQERAFPHYGESLETVKNYVLSPQDGAFVGAYLQDELVGFIHLLFGDKIAIISQILSMQKDTDKAVNNALVAKAVQVCADRKVEWVMYGRMGNHPSLDKFKESNNFTKYPLTRYYVPLTRKGRIAAKLGLHRDLKDTLPQPVKKLLFPLYNWVDRSKMRLKLGSKPRAS